MTINHSDLGLSMKKTRGLLKRMVDGETRLIADLMINNPIQLLDVTICAVTFIEAMQHVYPEAIDAMFAKELPN